MPRISIFTPTKDRPDWLPGCIASITAQDFGDFEHIIFDNGEESVEHLVPDDPHFRYVKGPAYGMVDAWNRALALCEGEIVHPLSDDDRLATADTLRTVSESIEDALWANALTSVEDAEGIVREVVGGRCAVERLREGYYLGGAIYWRRELTERLGFFDTDFEGAGDYDLYLRFAEDSEPVFIDRVLHRYIDHANTDSRLNGPRQWEATERIRAT